MKTIQLQDDEANLLQAILDLVRTRKNLPEGMGEDDFLKVSDGIDNTIALLGESFIALINR